LTGRTIRTATTRFPCISSTAFPLFDVLFGTCCAPRRNEYPATGLVSGEDLNGVVRASWAPFAFRGKDIGRRRGTRLSAEARETNDR
jgi:hypothetical protein